MSNISLRAFTKFEKDRIVDALQSKATAAQDENDALFWLTFAETIDDVGMLQGLTTMPEGSQG